MPPSGVFFHCSPQCFLIQNLSLNLKVAILARLTGQLSHRDAPSPPTLLASAGVTDTHLYTQPVHMCWGIELRSSSLHCKRITSQTMSPAQNVRIVWGEGCSLPEDILYCIKQLYFPSTVSYPERFHFMSSS